MPKQTQNQPKQISSAAEVIVYIAERLKLARSIKLISNENLEFIHLFSRIRDTRIKQALLGILREI